MTAHTTMTALDAALAKAARPEARHVFTRLMEDSARAEAAAADGRRKAGINLGPLDGVLVTIKDLYDVAGMVTTAGSKILADAAPAKADAPVIARLRRAGAVLVGRTNMTEFAYSGLGLNPHYGTPGSGPGGRHVPGGSTAGGAVSVSLGIAPLTLGSDTGGSTRIPAAFNGIVGFKPTSPRVPTAGAFPLSYTLDSVGPMGRSVADCAAMDAVLAGIEAEALPRVPLAGLRIGVPRGWLFSEMEAEVGAAFEAALVRLEAAGARIADVDYEDLFAAMREANTIAQIGACEAAQIHAANLKERRDGFDPRVRSRIEGGVRVPAPAYIEVRRRREALKAPFAARIADVDVLALPTTVLRAPLITPLEQDDALYTATNVKVLRNTNPFNFFDCPALTMPLPVSDGLPIGFMIAGAPFADRRLLAIGAAMDPVLKG